MENTVLYIKNMVCPRCVKTVEEELKKTGATVEYIELGKVELKGQIGVEAIKEIDKVLAENGFELIYDKKSQIIEKLKITIIEIIHHDKEVSNNVNISEFIAEALGYDYSYLSNLFSSAEGTTIEKFIVQQKIEKAKELLSYNELSLTEISHQLGYSSVQYLSNQFKKTTGLTPSQFKKQKENRRNPLDRV